MGRMSYRWGNGRNRVTMALEAGYKQPPAPEPAPGLLLAYHPIPVPVPGAGHHRLGKSLPISLVALTRCSPAAAASSQDRYTSASCALPALGLNQYQGGICNSEVLKITERTLSRASTKWATGVSKARINVRLTVQHKCHPAMRPL